MADKYIQIASFKYGLDARRQELVSQPGVLVTCQNAHINSGGEVVKRKAFVTQANSFATNTYGLQDTDQGLMTFGSDVAPNTPLPTGVIYQRLACPQAYIPGTVPPVPDRMIGVVFSSNFLGKAFVLAQFTNAVFGFYDGTLIPAFRNGLVLQVQLPVSGIGESLSQLAVDLAAQVNVVDGWSAVANVDENGATLLGSVIVKSPGGVHFTPITSFSSQNGELGATLIDQNVAGVNGSAASVAFVLTGAGGTVAVSAPQQHPDNGSVADLTGGAIPFNTSLAQTATDVVTAINTRTFITGYSATSTGATVTVTAPAAFGNDTDLLTVVTVGGTLDATGGVITVPGFMIVLTPQTLDVTFHATSPSRLVSGKISASTVGASGAVSRLLATTTGTFNIPSFGNTTTVNVDSGLLVTNGVYVRFTFGFAGSVVLKVTAGGGTGTLTILNDGFDANTGGGIVGVGSLVRNDILWAECNSDGSIPVTLRSGITLLRNFGGTANFQAFLLANTSKSGTFCCIAQSQGATPLSSKKLFTVSLQYTSP